MADTRLNDVILDREENYLLPFYWQHGTHRDRIPAQVQRIYVRSVISWPSTVTVPLCLS